jgi:hypothetical protein
MGPPEGYITATEAKNILNVSASMVRVHAQKGRIRYITPRQRKQSFYLKKDVEKLARDLNIFLAIEPEEELSQFTQAKPEDLPEILELSRQLFESETREQRETSFETRIALMKKNSDVYHVLKREGQVIGFTHILPFKPDTDKIGKLLRVNYRREVPITPDDIVAFKAGQHVHLYIAAIGIKPDIATPKRRIYAATLISKFAQVIIDLGKKGVIIETMTAIGFSKEGRKLLQEFGFSEVPPSIPGKRVFSLKVEESGSPPIMEYKETLKETQTRELSTSTGLDSQSDSQHH